MNKRYQNKMVIAHRGASGYLPEHTLPAKAMAYAQGADYLEQDLVLTKDNRLVVFHDHYLDRVTDVAQQFPDRARADGRYYVIDFTLSEIRQLNVIEAFDIQNGKPVAIYPKRFPIGKSRFVANTFEEEIEFIQGLNYSTGRQVGLYPEIKVPWFHRKEGKEITQQVLSVLKQYGYTQKDHLVYLQCFDPNELKRIRSTLFPMMGMDLKLVQLIAQTDWKETFVQDTDGRWENYDYDWMFEAGAMKKVALYADVIGPQYQMLIEEVAKNQLENHQKISFTAMLAEAKQAQLSIHPYTIRADQLPACLKTVDQLFQLLYLQADVEGVFTDFPDLAVQFLST